MNYDRLQCDNDIDNPAHSLWGTLLGVPYNYPTTYLIWLDYDLSYADNGTISTNCAHRALKPQDNFLSLQPQSNIFHCSYNSRRYYAPQHLNVVEYVS